MRLGIVPGEKLRFSLFPLRSAFTIFGEDRMRLGIVPGEKLRFSLFLLRSAFIIFG